MRRLGSTQQDVLEALQRHGKWHPNCGWLWTTYRVTQKHMERLVELGHAKFDGVKTYYPLAPKHPAAVLPQVLDDAEVQKASEDRARERRRRIVRDAWTSHLDRACECGCKLGEHFPGGALQPCYDCNGLDGKKNCNDFKWKERS